jgi:hypothetical protein
VAAERRVPLLDLAAEQLFQQHLRRPRLDSALSSCLLVVRRRSFSSPPCAALVFAFFSLGSGCLRAWLHCVI